MSGAGTIGGADATRLLQVWDADFMAFGQGVPANSWTTALAQTQADYLALSMTRLGHYTSSTASDFRNRKAANGAPRGIFLWYDNTGGVFTNLTGSIGSFIDNSMPMTDFFGTGRTNGIPDDLLVYNQEAPAGNHYKAAPGLADVPRMWDQRWRSYLAAYYASTTPPWVDGITPDVMGREFATLSVEVGGSGTTPWQPLLKAATVHGDPSWPPLWVDSLAATAAYLQAALGRRMAVLPNCLKDGFQYWATDGGQTSKIIAGCIGGMSELFLRDSVASATSWPAETHQNSPNWQDSVDMILDSNATGRVLVCDTKLWNTATTLQSMQWFRLVFGTFLIATNGLHYVAYRQDDPTSGQVTLTGGSNIITGSGTAFTTQIGNPASGVISFVGLGGVATYPIASVDSDTHITLTGNVQAGDAGSTSQWSTTHPMQGRHVWKPTAFFADVPNFGVGVVTGPNPDQVNWYTRILNLDGTLKLGQAIDNYTVPISAQRHTGGGSAYYFRRFTKGLVIVNPTSTDVTALDATAAPISAPGAGAGWSDVGAELTQGINPSITSLTVPAHSALIMTHN